MLKAHNRRLIAAAEKRLAKEVLLEEAFMAC
jgi:hypothetical protein